MKIIDNKNGTITLNFDNLTVAKNQVHPVSLTCNKKHKKYYQRLCKEGSLIAEQHLKMIRN